MASKKKTAAPSRKAKAPKKKSQVALRAALEGVTASDARDAVATTRFVGTIQLTNSESKAFLQTTSLSYLLMLDPLGNGNYDPTQVGAAYTQFSGNPGDGGRLICQGFDQKVGGVDVLHVVRIG